MDAVDETDGDFDLELDDDNKIDFLSCFYSFNVISIG